MYQWAFVDCRIGSLESNAEENGKQKNVDCRIGSLEKYPRRAHGISTVDCRIGSLESNRQM